jgi:hypothetical protein
MNFSTVLLHRKPSIILAFSGIQAQPLFCCTSEQAIEGSILHLDCPVMAWKELLQYHLSKLQMKMMYFLEPDEIAFAYCLQA